MKAGGNTDHNDVVLTPVGSGALYDADCAAGDPESLPGTHRNSDGVLTGYVIDYMLHVPAVHVFRRDQRPAVADHDLVSYDIQVAALPEQYCWPAKPCVLPTAEISDEIWRSAWAPCEAGFNRALQQQDVTRAWDILSGCFAVLLTKRGAWTPPTQPKSRESCAHRRAPTFQSLTERQLRRLARRAHEFTTCDANARLVSAIDRSVRELVSNFSSLAAQPWGTLQAAQHVRDLADAQAQADAEARCQITFPPPRFACVRSCQHVFLDGLVGCCCPYYCAGMGMSLPTS